ncbi:OmpW/AlkL family protein [Dokdonella koreensis]|uniref:Outer membrane protein W n=1 Tax=Dokdonella koreensis DS-123 TaxID=1300342 RepID=A0A160DYL5_9GAMM|nr:OmpW family outer membrane protein [Dokdonella koreensis]ANB19511.1 Outer membrane protein W [Dokdonella koreensis DS-123]
MKQMLAAAVLAVLATGTPALHAADAGDWQVKVGAHVVDPKSNNGTLADGTLKARVDSDWKPTFTVEYYFSRNLGLEVLAALPFKHEVKLNGAKAAETKHLPPTVSLQWHFLPDAKVNPFVGLGLNYTRFFSTDETGPLEGTNLDLDDSWGLAAHLGVDFALKDRWSLTVDARWMDIDTDVKVNGTKVGTVNIDPLVYGIAVGYRF